MITTQWNRLSVDHSRCFPPHCVVPASSQSYSFTPISLHPPETLQPVITMNSCNMPQPFRPVSLIVCVCVCVFVLCRQSACTHIPVVIGESSSPLLSYITPYASLCWCWCVGSPICPRRRCSESKCLDAWVEDIKRDEEKGFFVTTQHRSTSAALNMWRLYVVHLSAFLLLLCFSLPFLSNSCLCISSMVWGGSMSWGISSR